jgi:hypothetical protein
MLTSGDTRRVLLLLLPVVPALLAVELVSCKLRLEEHYHKLAGWQLLIPAGRLFVALLAAGLATSDTAWLLWRWRSWHSRISARWSAATSSCTVMGPGRRRCLNWPCRMRPACGRRHGLTELPPHCIRSFSRSARSCSSTWAAMSTPGVSASRSRSCRLSI